MGETIKMSTEQPTSSDQLSSLPQLDIYGLSFRLLAIADDDREDDWLRDVCRQSGEMLENLSRIVTCDPQEVADMMRELNDENA